MWQTIVVWLIVGAVVISVAAPLFVKFFVPPRRKSSKKQRDCYGK